MELICQINHYMFVVFNFLMQADEEVSLCDMQSIYCNAFDKSFK